VARARTQHHELCRSGSDEAGAGMAPLMETDSELLLREGIATGQETFEALQRELGWSPVDIDKTVCHQVGATHRRLMLEQLGLTTEIDFATFETLGNTGSVALPISMARAAEAGHFDQDDHVALMGIGSGINCVMLGLHWQHARMATGASPRRFGWRAGIGAR
jgi:3-oxoacyl-[acyl-carrier-protein] synthase-3